MANFTEREIKRSFIKLLNEKPLSKISVRDIVEDCGINRNSFYYHFQDIPALLEEIVSEQSAAIIQKYPQPDSLEECFRAAFEFALSNKRAAYNIFNSVNRDLLDRELLRLCDKTVSAYIVKADGRVINIELSLAGLEPAERDIIVSGCLMNYYKKQLRQ